MGKITILKNQEKFGAVPRKEALIVAPVRVASLRTPLSLPNRSDDKGSRGPTSSTNVASELVS